MSLIHFLKQSVIYLCLIFFFLYSWLEFNWVFIASFARFIKKINKMHLYFWKNIIKIIFSMFFRRIFFTILPLFLFILVLKRFLLFPFIALLSDEKLFVFWNVLLRRLVFQKNFSENEKYGYKFYERKSPLFAKLKDSFFPTTESWGTLFNMIRYKFVSWLLI